jgi:hypothetical protein
MILILACLVPPFIERTAHNLHGCLFAMRSRLMHLTPGGGLEFFTAEFAGVVSHWFAFGLNIF